ncbi:ArsR/SmtB family transcription factor [Streptomyces sp. NPDC047706]|uniref:ArsR/SmtB family transcription factor n=1 Tax=Streptomyces sp. NPDC047706 TaxID=3365486 RepID=UPI0037105738
MGPGVRPVAKSTLSHHLKVLREAGVTQTRQEGTRCYVTLRRETLDARFPGLCRRCCPQPSPATSENT